MVAFISKVFLIVAFCFGSLAAQNDLIIKKEGSSQTVDKKEKGKGLSHQNKASYLEDMIKEFVLTGDFDKLNETIRSSTALENKEGLIMDIRELKVAYDMMCYDLDDFEIDLIEF